MFKNGDVVRCTYDWLEGIYGKDGIVVGYDEKDNRFVNVYYPDLKEGEKVNNLINLYALDKNIYNEKKYFAVLEKDLILIKGCKEVYNMFKKGDRVQVIGNNSGHHFNIGDIVTIDHSVDNTNSYICTNQDGDYWCLNVIDFKLVEENKGDDNMFKVNDKVVILGVAGLIHALKVGTVGTIIDVISDNLIKVEGVSVNNPDMKIVQILNKKQVELKGDDSMNKLVGKEMVALVDSLKGVYIAGNVGVITKFRNDEDGAVMGLQFNHKKSGVTTWVKPENFKPADVEFNVGDILVALVDSAMGVYDAGDIGIVCGFRLDADGAVMGIKFDHKKDSTTTWVKPENFDYATYDCKMLEIGQDVVMTSDSAKGVYNRLDVGTITKFREDKDGATVGVKFKHKRAGVTTWVKPQNLMVVPVPDVEYVPYGKIKIFNLTSLLSHNWDMIAGVLCLRGSDYKLSGIMKNIIDKEFDALDMGDDNILIELDGVEYVINKALRGTLFKKVK